MPARAALPYVAVNPRPSGPAPARPSTSDVPSVLGGPAPTRPGAATAALPVDSPTLLSRRRYGDSSHRGYEVQADLGQIVFPIPVQPWPGQGFNTPHFPNRAGSTPTQFAGGLVPGLTRDMGIKPIFAWGRNLLVAIAHRNPLVTVEPPRAGDVRVTADRDIKGRPRRYAMPWQYETPISVQQWPTSSQWLASRLPGR